MKQIRKAAAPFGAACIGLTAAMWLAFYLLPPQKVDSALQRLPLLAPLSWIELWFTVALACGLVAATRRRRWLIAPAITAVTAVLFFVRILA